MTHRESHGKSGFPLGNIVDFLETENMFSIAGPRTSWWLLSHLEPCLQSLVLEGQALSLRKVEEKFEQVFPAS